jgi:RNA polymerase sigma factor (sigma-70 family)
MDDIRRRDFLEVFLSVRERLAAAIQRRVECAATTADLTQDTFLRLWERPGLLRDVSDLAGYFVTTGRNLAADHERRRRIAPFVAGVDHLEYVADNRPSAEDVVLTRDELKKLQDIVNSLPPKCRQVFLLSRIEGLSYVEIGTKLGISPKTVFSHMVTALERLKAGM